MLPGCPRCGGYSDASSQCSMLRSCHHPPCWHWFGGACRTQEEVLAVGLHLDEKEGQSQLRLCPFLLPAPYNAEFSVIVMR